MLLLLGYNFKIYLMRGVINFWWEGIFLGGGGMSKFLAGEERTRLPFPSRENPNLHSSLRFFNFKEIYIPCLSY